ncbi:MAG TPA: hypothetical protein VES02_09450 [Dermatophilaceae bacterium]|nr:hypothetical protein [Dermatophilaceae bacterium]
MDRIPETIDVADLVERLKPLAHQTSERLHQTSESVRQAIDHARAAIADRVKAEMPIMLLERPAALALPTRRLTFEPPLPLARGGRSPVQWLLVAIAVAVLATLSAVVLAAIVRRLQGSRRRGPTIQPVTRPAEPVAIPVVNSIGDAAEEVEAEHAELADRVAEAG